MMAHGMNAETGKVLEGIGHLKQSIQDILTTPIGSRVMRREYGSRLFELVDAPTNQGTLVELYAATAEAIDRWEPRFNLLKVSADVLEPGRISLRLEGEYLPNGQTVTLDGVIV